MSRPMRTTYRILTLIPTGPVRPARMQTAPVLPGELGDLVTKIRRRGEAEGPTDRETITLVPAPRLQAC